MVANTFTRRQAIRAAGAAGLVGTAGCLDNLGSSENVSGNVKIGVLQPVSGTLKYYGQQSLWGFFSGLAHRGDNDPLAKDKAKAGDRTVEVGDVTYELYVRDTKFDSKTAQDRATDLVNDQGVDLLFGVASSSASSRVINQVVKASGTPYVAGPAASAGITADSKTCRENVFRASETTAMDARSGGRYVAEETDVEKVYLFGADYSFGKAVVNNYEAVMSDAGVDIVGKKFVQRGHSEWKGLLDNAEEEGADGIVGGFTVQTLPKLFTAFLSGEYSYRVFGGFATRFTDAILGQTLQKVLGEPLTAEKLQDAKLGPFTTRYHWNQYDNEINNSFIDKHTSAYGVVPDLFSSGTFTAASAIDQAVEASGSTAGEDIAEAMRGMTVADTPKGEDAYRFQEYNNQARSEMTVADPVPTSDEWADSWGAAIMPSEPVARIGADRTTIPKSSSQMNCSL